MWFFHFIFILFVVFKSDHDRKSSSPILIHEDDFLITEPFAAYELDSQVIIDLPNQGKFVLINPRSGKWVNEQFYSKLFNSVSVTNLKSLINDLRKADPQFKQLTNINSGWFTSHRANIIYVGYANYSREPESEFAVEEGMANVLLVLNQELNAMSGSLLFPTSMQMLAKPPAIIYYPNAYFSGDIIKDNLYIPNYYLNVNQLSQNLPAFSVWDVTDLSQIKETLSIGKANNFLPKNIEKLGIEAVYLANVTSFKQNNKSQLIALSQDGIGEDLIGNVSLSINPNTILIQGLRGVNKPDRLLFLDYRPNDKSAKRYFTSKSLMKEDSIPIIPPDGYTIKRIVEQRNNHFTNAKFILSKNDSLYLWSYSY